VCPQIIAGGVPVFDHPLCRDGILDEPPSGSTLGATRSAAST
jgi:hypothetical protein